MNSVLKDPFASRVSILSANYIVLLLPCSEFLSLCVVYSPYSIFAIKTYKVSSCVSLAPVI